jgi:flagellin
MVYSIVTNENAVVVGNNVNRSKAKSGILLDELSTGKKSILGGNVSDIIIGGGLKRAQNALQAILDGIPQATGILNTATSALQQIQDLLNRQSTLARKSQSSSGDDIRAILQDEFSNLTSEINRIANSTSFNGVKILNGNLDTKSSLNSDVRLNDITTSLNVGTSALSGATDSVVFDAGTFGGNGLNAAEIDAVINAFNVGTNLTAAGFTTGTDSAALTLSVNLGGVTFTTDVAKNIQTSKTIALYEAGNNATGTASITFKLGTNEFFNSALGATDFETRLAADINSSASKVVLNQKKLGGVFADTSAIGTELLTVGTNFVVTVAAGAKGDSFLVGDLSTIQLSGKYGTDANDIDISAVINGKVYSVSSYNFADVAQTTLGLTNAETGTTITLNRDVTKIPALSNQATLDAALAKLKGDLDGIKVYQTRQIGSGSLDQFKPKAFDNTILGGLDGFSLKLTSSSFSLALDDNGVPLNTTPTFEGFKVTAEDTTKGLDGAIQVTIGGEVFRTAIGTFDGKNTDLKTAFTPPTGNGTAEITLVNERDANERFTIDLFRAKSSGINLDTEAAATTLENALNLAFNTTRESKISFQVGLDNSDNIGITVGRVTTDQIYKNADGQARNLDISTNAGAQEAVDVLAIAIRKLDSITGKVAAAYTRFQKVEENIRTGIQNNNAAAAPLLDTDFTSAASELAAQQVLEQAGLSALSKNLQGLTNVLQLLR